MDLEERIARLIDPDICWDEADTDDDAWTQWHTDDWKRNRAKKAARRVIDGLGLTEEQRGNPTCAPESWSLGQQACIGFLMSGDCPHVRHEHRLVTPWEAQ